MGNKIKIINKCPLEQAYERHDGGKWHKVKCFKNQRQIYKRKSNIQNPLYTLLFLKKRLLQ